jgi:hypothetical protein
MIRTYFVAALAAAFISSGASAQATGAASPGGGDAAKSSSNSREENASYNRVIGSMGEARKRGRAVAAAPADVVAGSDLRDVQGVPVGRVEAIDGDVAIVATAIGRVKIPLIGFGKDKLGLMLSMTAAELETAIRAVQGS